MPASVSAWNAPILPSPMSPMRMLSLSLLEWTVRWNPRSGAGRERRAGAVGLLGAVAAVHDQGDAQRVGDRDGDRRAGADAVDELADHADPDDSDVQRHDALLDSSPGPLLPAASGQGCGRRHNAVNVAGPSNGPQRVRRR
jgi:hypothetical protein